MKNLKNSFSVRITDLRMQKNITQKKAAEDLGISAAQLSHYEKGIRECSLSFVLKLAEYYDVSCDYLLGKETSLNSASYDRKLYSNEAENAIYSILSPEGYSSILWKDSSRYKEAAEKMKLTAEELYELKVIDKIIEEPDGDEKESFKKIINTLKEEINRAIIELKKLDADAIVEERYQKFRNMGEFIRL